MGKGGEEGEETGEGLGGACGVFNGEPGTSVVVAVVGAQDGEGHREAVVVVGVDGDGVGEGAGVDFKGVVGFDDVLVEFAEFTGGVADAVGFLEAGVGNASYANDAVDERGEGGEGEEGVGEGAEIFDFR